MKKSKRVDLNLGRGDPPKRAWYEAIADAHNRSDSLVMAGWRCSCSVCRTARQEGYRPKLANPKS